MDDVATPEDAGTDAATDADAGSTMSCSGRPGMHTGQSTQQVMAGNLPRTFVYYAPPNLDPNRPAPLVIAAHGFTMNGQIMSELTEFNDVADREGFVVAYPDGFGAPGPWNVGPGICGAGAAVGGVNDDQAFMEEIMAFVDGDRCLDRDHVFMTGFSMGGYFSNEMACQRSDIAAIAPHSGGSHDLTLCPGSKKPVMVMHVESDALIAHLCGQEAAFRWVERNGCSLENPRVVPVQSGSCAYYEGCDPGAQVAFCSFVNPPGSPAPFFGHGWAGGAGVLGVTGAESATELSWTFFREYAW